MTRLYFPIYVLLVCKYSMQRRDKYAKMIIVLSKNHTYKVSCSEWIFIRTKLFCVIERVK